MNERFTHTPPGPDYFMEIAGDERAESTGGHGHEPGAERAWRAEGESSADADDRAPEFEI